ncbi:hypothetical protein MHTCC0001_29860 [Flavobacteriaceae bacterium MHTCC 0001]
MKNFKVVAVFAIVLFGLLTSCTKQDLNEDSLELIDKNEIENPRDH